MSKLRMDGKVNFKDCVWTDLGTPFEEQVKADPEGAVNALKAAMERQERKQANSPKYSKEHHGGYEY